MDRSYLVPQQLADMPGYGEATKAVDATVKSAAWDMYEVLKMLTHNLPSDKYMQDQGQKPGPLLVAARKAVAKAEGRHD